MAGQSITFDFLTTGAEKTADGFRKVGDNTVLAAKGAKVLADTIEGLGRKEDRTAAESKVLAAALRQTGDAEDRVAARAVLADAAIRRVGDAMKDVSKKPLIPQVQTAGALKSLAGIKLKAEELRAKFPQFTVQINDKAAKAELAVFAAEAKVTLDKIDRDISAAGSKRASLLSRILPGGGGGAAGAGAAEGGSGLTRSALPLIGALPPQAQVAAIGAAIAALPFIAQTAAGGITFALGGALAGLAIAGASKTKSVQDSFARLKTSASASLGQIGVSFVPVMNSILGTARNVLGQLTPIFAGAAKTIAAPFQAFGNALVKAFGQPAVKQSIRDVASAFGAILKAVTPTLGADIGYIATGISKIAGSIKENPQAFASFISFLFKAAGAALTAIAWLTRVASYIETHFGPAMHRVAVIFDGVRHQIAHIWDMIFQNSVGMMIRLGHNVATQFNSIRHGIAVNFDGIRHNVAASWNLVFSNTAGSLIRIGHNVATQFNSMRHSTAAIFAGVRHDIAAAWDAIWSNTVGRAIRGVSAFGTAVGRIKDAMLGPIRWVVNNVINRLISAFDWVSKQGRRPAYRPRSSSPRAAGYPGSAVATSCRRGSRGAARRCWNPAKPSSTRTRRARSWDARRVGSSRVRERREGRPGTPRRRRRHDQPAVRPDPRRRRRHPRPRLGPRQDRRPREDPGGRHYREQPPRPPTRSGTCSAADVGGATGDLAGMLAAMPGKLLTAAVKKLLSFGGSGNAIVADAMKWIGKIPYMWGGTAVPGGADCCGFVQAIYGRHGISAPRTSEAQGAWVKRCGAVPGGLAFYNSPAGGPPPGHVAIVKDGSMVISQGGGMGPRLMPLTGAMPLMFTGIPPGGFGKAGGLGSYQVGAGVGQWRGVTQQALGMAGADVAQLTDPVLYQMRTESGGNA